MALKKHIHFMGIAGSGMSAVAQIAAAQGYKISGCDLNLDSPYFTHLKSHVLQSGGKLPPSFFSGHNPTHLKDVDLLAVTPAVFYQNNNHPEVELAKKRGILVKWQDFLGQHLHQNKFVISIAGTHGKSTTTAMAGILLESAGFDPTVEIGATVSAWHNNVRIGTSNYFISEADEFHDNFSSFKSDVIILTLLEMDHPEYFGTESKMIASFQHFIDNRKPNATVIVNTDSPLVSKLSLPKTTITYSLGQVKNIRLETYGSTFSYQGLNYEIKIPGRHNISNSLAVILLAKILNIDSKTVASTLKWFQGINRRLELLGQKNNIHVYDDYANHPSSFAATISAVKQLHPQSRIVTVIEPHTYSRLKVLLHQLPQAVTQADEVIVSDIYASRETDPGNFTGQDIVTAMHHQNAKYIPEFSNIVEYLKTNVSPTDVILIMGSGKSHQLSRQILSGI